MVYQRTVIETERRYVLSDNSEADVTKTMASLFKEGSLCYTSYKVKDDEFLFEKVGLKY